MKKHNHKKSQTSELPIPGLAEFFGADPEPAKHSTDPTAQKTERREHAGAPAPGIDYGFEYSEAGVPDAQGYVEVTLQVVPIVDFDYERVYRDLDGDKAEDAKAAIMRLAAIAFGEMIEWTQEEFSSPDSGIRWNPETSLRCKSALVRYYRSPATMGNPTMRQLAHRLGISPQNLSLLWAEFKSRFPGVIAPWEKTAAAKEAYSQAHKEAA